MYSYVFSELMRQTIASMRCLKTKKYVIDLSAFVAEQIFQFEVEFYFTILILQGYELGTG